MRHEVKDLARASFVTLESLERGHLDDRCVVARELVLVEKFANLYLDELEQFFVVDHVDLVESHDDVRNTNLASKQARAHGSEALDRQLQLQPRSRRPPERHR